MTPNNKVNINGTEYDTRDFNPEQLELLDAVAFADRELYKLRARQTIQQAGREELFTQLIKSLENIETNDK